MYYMMEIFQFIVSGIVITYLFRYHSQAKSNRWDIPPQLVLDISTRLRRIEQELDRIPKKRGPKTRLIKTKKMMKRRKKND